MFAFSQGSSVGAVGSPASECQSSPPLSPPGGSGGRAKRQIPHEDRELSEIKKRMWGLRVHCETEEAAAAVPLEGVVEEGEEEWAAVEMESDDDGQKEEEEVGEAVEGGTPMVRSDSQESSASTSSTGSGGGKISDDDPRALMLRALYTRRVEPKDRVEAKIESLIRASLRRCVHKPCSVCLSVRLSVCLSVVCITFSSLLGGVAQTSCGPIIYTCIARAERAPLGAGAWAARQEGARRWLCLWRCVTPPGGRWMGAAAVVVPTEAAEATWWVRWSNDPRVALHSRRLT